MAHEEVRLETYSALLGGGMKHETVHPALGIGVLGRGGELRGAKKPCRWCYRRRMHIYDTGNAAIRGRTRPFFIISMHPHLW